MVRREYRDEGIYIILCIVETVVRGTGRIQDEDDCMEFGFG